jgi:MYXO-CTERM domain-containing protein
MAYPPLVETDPTRIEQAAEAVPAGGSLRLHAEGISIEGREVSQTVMLPMGAPAPGAERLAEAGLELRTEEGRVFIDMIGFASAAERAGLDFDFEITSVLGASDRPPKELMWLPALLALGLIVWLQRRRGPALPAPRAAPVAAGED